MTSDANHDPWRVIGWVVKSPPAYSGASADAWHQGLDVDYLLHTTILHQPQLENPWKFQKIIQTYSQLQKKCTWDESPVDRHLLQQTPMQLSEAAILWVQSQDGQVCLKIWHPQNLIVEYSLSMFIIMFPFQNLPNAHELGYCIQLYTVYPICNNPQYEVSYGWR